jgi:hypothetical protein
MGVFQMCRKNLTLNELIPHYCLLEEFCFYDILRKSNEHEKYVNYDKR